MALEDLAPYVALENPGMGPAHQATEQFPVLGKGATRTTRRTGFRRRTIERSFGARQDDIIVSFPNVKGGSLIDVELFIFDEARKLQFLAGFGGS